jgi:ubiquinol-cytochrome c reductase cytochrome b subunit
MLLGWVNARFPLSSLWHELWGSYYAPKNLNIWYSFGALAGLVLVMQILTGIFLTMHYKADAAHAFESVEYIMRDVPWGWLVRYMHSTGASAFFIVIYLHMWRALIYGSSRKPRELVWLVGCVILLCLMAEAFMGYLLPWGQTSYWGAQVIVNLFSAVPFIGPDLSLLIRGDYVVGDATLNRFFSLHVIAIPLVLLGLAVVHVIALHEVGSNNPDGLEVKERLGADGHPLDSIPSHPYYTVHDIFSATVFLAAFSAVVFFAPEGGGYFLEFNNFVEANPLRTPAHIAPVWYFTPYYSMLRATTDLLVNVLAVILAVATVLSILLGGLRVYGKVILAVVAVLAVALLKTFEPKFWGVVVMAGAVLILFALPWLDRSPVKSIRYRPRWHKVVFGVFAVNFLALGYLGSQPPSVAGNYFAQLGTLLYFGFFLLMPWWSRIGAFKRAPDRVVYEPR